MRRTTVKLALFLGLFCLAAAPLQAETYFFSSVTNNVAGDVIIGEAQLSVEVTNAGGGNVLFTFKNVGGAAATQNNPRNKASFTVVLLMYRSP